MTKALDKRLKKLTQRKKGYSDIRKKTSGKKGNAAYKEPGSMNLHKQLG